EETHADRMAALTRLLNALHALSEAARVREFGPTGGPATLPRIDAELPADLVGRLVADPIAWFDRERPVVMAGIRQAVQAGRAELCWRIAMNAEPFFELRVYLDEWREIQEIALAAARQAGDERGQAEMLCVRGALAQTEQRFGDARRDFEGALSLFEKTADVFQMAKVRRDLAFLERMNGQLDEAAMHLEQALAIFVELGDQILAAHTLDNLAAIRAECGDIDDAKIMLAEALVRGKSGGSRRAVSQILHRMGRVHLQAEEFALAAGAFEEALTIVEGTGDSVGEAFALHGLGIAQLRRGKIAEAEPLLQRAYAKAQSARNRLAEAHSVAGLGELAITMNRPDDAAGRLYQAVVLFQQMRVPLREAHALMMLTGVQRALGEEDAAKRGLARVQELADEVDERAARTLRAHLELLATSRSASYTSSLSGNVG
ncbi:tetratricopeptide repeat protein, partial [Nonomuraea sp. NPDC004297]